MALKQVPITPYLDVAGSVSAAAKTQIAALLDQMFSRFPDSENGTSAQVPDYDQMPAHIEVKLRKELVALKAAITAAP